MRSKPKLRACIDGARLWPAIVALLSACQPYNFEENEPTEPERSPVNAPAAAVCGVEQVLDELGPAGAPWSGEPAWTREELDSCLALCPDRALRCIQRECQAPEAFLDCYLGELGHCAADREGAPCASEYVEYGCCVLEAECERARTQAEFDACIDGSCQGETDGFAECSERECQQEAQRACVEQLASPDE